MDAANTATYPRRAIRSRFKSIPLLRSGTGPNRIRESGAFRVHCNRFKGPNIAGFDPDSRQVVRLFDPRHDIWAEHFAWDGAELQGLTAIGRLTISVLFINDSDLILMREVLRTENVIL